MAEELPFDEGTYYAWVWEDGNGNTRWIEDMTNSHLLNVANFLEMEFFVRFPHLVHDDWVIMAPRVAEEYDAFPAIVLEMNMRDNPWKGHEDGRTAHCETLLDAYHVLKRNMVQEGEP